MTLWRVEPLPPLSFPPSLPPSSSHPPSPSPPPPPSLPDSWGRRMGRSASLCCRPVLSAPWWLTPKLQKLSLATTGGTWYRYPIELEMTLWRVEPVFHGVDRGRVEFIKAKEVAKNVEGGPLVGTMRRDDIIIGRSPHRPRKIPP